ncbi:hypothetical protein PINS_up010810 [Pythium insidiosum]|nr:hypothetical protein PINS_up010810 [Pythium insidiosum]
MSSAGLDATVNKTYQALLSVVQTTAVTKRVLARPPFTFLHKLLVETLSEYKIFTEQQLMFTELVTKEDKAAFLTRAIAFISFTKTRLQDKCINVLFLVSPVKVLAGVAVEDTLEFLQQLCEVCRSTDREAKEFAAKEVQQKGDAQLYTAGVTFRKGLVLIQAVVRAFIRRRVKRKAAGNNTRGIALPVGEQLRLEVGTRFLKELVNGRIYDGVIVAIVDKRYRVRYDQDPGAEDDVDEIEMKILLEESFRLQQLRERIAQDTRPKDDVDISLTDLPDLSTQLQPAGAKTRSMVKRHSSKEIDITKTSPTLNRAMSTLATTELRTDPRRSSVTMSPSKEDSGYAGSGSPPPQTDRVWSDLRTEDERSVIPNATSPGATETWQMSLQSKLVMALEGASPEVRARKETGKRITQRSSMPSQSSSAGASNIPMGSHLPVFPQLAIPGKKQLPPVSKRKQPTAGFSPSSASIKPVVRAKGPGEIETSRSKRSDGSHASVVAQDSNSQTQSSTHSAGFTRRIPPMPSTGETPVDTAFGGRYQSTDQKTQERLALFREIVHRIDAFMKRKRLRVIDLFRFCDADGNGSISPQEMIDTLSQMEIHLTPEQAHDFINHIDKDGNGSIDVDEFEELVRVARRNEAQRELLRKELQHSKKQATAESKSTNKYAALFKHRQRIIDELRTLAMSDVGPLSVSQVKTALTRLQLAGLDDSLIDDLIERAQLQLVSSSTTKGMTDVRATGGKRSADGVVYIPNMTKALNELTWSCKSNRFLDQSWLAQFDSQLERAQRDFELL